MNRVSTTALHAHTAIAGAFRIALITSVASTTYVVANDANHDGMDDIWQQRWFVAPFDGASDIDTDGRINLVESLNGSDPYTAQAGLGMVNIKDTSPPDGMDDDWQALYQISSASALADPDSDGRANVEESIVGSNPHVADVPWGQIPAGSGIATGGLDTFTLGVPRAFPAARYRLQSCADMESWADVPDSTVWSTGAPISHDIGVQGQPRMFFRYIIDYPDTDGDTLPDWYEHMVYLSDPTLADSDGDGDSDALEAGNGTSPTNAFDHSADPIPEMRGQVKSVSNHWERWVGSDNIPGTDCSITWFDQLGGSDSQYYSQFESRWHDRFEQLQWPNTGTMDEVNSWGVGLNQLGVNSQYIQVGPPWLPDGHQINDVGLSHARYQMIIPGPAKRALHRDFAHVIIKQNLQPGAADPEVKVLDITRFTIPKDDSSSNVVELQPPVGPTKDFNHISRLVPVDFEDEQAFSGLDLVSPERWLMVPWGGTNRLYILGCGGLDAKVWPGGPTYATVNPQRITDDRQLLFITSSGVPDGEGLTLGLDTEPTTDPLLRFVVLPPLELKLTLHPITLVSPNGNPLEAPVNTPTKEALESFLDLTFGDQANVHFDVTISNGASVNWDVGVGVGDPAAASEGQGDRVFTFLLGPAPGRSAEEIAMANSIHDSTADVNIYFFAAGNLSRVYGAFTYLWWQNRAYPRAPFLGIAENAKQSNEGNIFVWDYDAPGQPGDTGPVRPSHLFTIAHEVAHYIGGLRHSTDSDLDTKTDNMDRNISYLEGTDNDFRLMTAKEDGKRSSNPRMLNKEEWGALSTKNGVNDF